MGRTEAIEYRRFRVIEIWELQDDLAAGRLLVPFVHMRAASTPADMHKLDLDEAIWVQKSAVAMMCSLTPRNRLRIESVFEDLSETNEGLAVPDFHLQSGTALR
jgi:hypothetical protein